MNRYQRELQELRTDDEVQNIENCKLGYNFINTAGHGYLVVPNEDENYNLAKSIVGCGYTGRQAIYLEEDCEASEFYETLEGN